MLGEDVVNDGEMRVLGGTDGGEVPEAMAAWRQAVGVRLTEPARTHAHQWAVYQATPLVPATVEAAYRVSETCTAPDCGAGQVRVITAAEAEALGLCNLAQMQARDASS